MDEPRGILEAKELMAARLQAQNDLAYFFGPPEKVYHGIIEAGVPKEPAVIPPDPPRQRVLPRRPINFKRPKLLRVGRR